MSASVWRWRKSAHWRCWTIAEDKLYFAYGSNINLDQMAYRCPAAQVVGPVVLEGYELLFRGNASGNGVATIKPKEGQQVHGLLWRITPGCERSLDLYEGYPHLYEKESVAVRDNAGRQLTVMAYVMTDGDRWRSPALPSEYYYQGIREGYRQNGLPLSKLKQAWQHCAEEVHQMTELVNHTLMNRPRTSNRKIGRDR